MTDWKRAVLVVEYDDGALNAYEFTDLDTSKLTHRGLPGPAEFYMSGKVRAIRMGAETAVEREFIDAIDMLEPPRGDDDERGQ